MTNLLIIVLQNSLLLTLQGPSSMLLYLMLSGILLTRLVTLFRILLIIVARLRVPVAKLTAREQQMEGELRYVSSRIITNG